jgi:hypothetical protein
MTGSWLCGHPQDGGRPTVYLAACSCAITEAR